MENITNIELIHTMENKVNNVYKFVKLYNDYISRSRDYGFNEKLNMLSIHILTDIDENPSITVTELASKWYRTKGSISQVIKFLEKNNYIIKKNNEVNKKIYHLYTTEKGNNASNMHKKYDFNNINKTLQKLLKDCSEEEICSFYKVIDSYIKILKSTDK